MNKPFPIYDLARSRQLLELRRRSLRRLLVRQRPRAAARAVRAELREVPHQHLVRPRPTEKGRIQMLACLIFSAPFLITGAAFTLGHVIVYRRLP